MPSIGRERTIRFRAPERGKPTFVVTRRAAAPDPKQSPVRFVLTLSGVRVYLTARMNLTEFPDV